MLFQRSIRLFDVGAVVAGKRIVRLDPGFICRMSHSPDGGLVAQDLPGEFLKLSQEIQTSFSPVRSDEVAIRRLKDAGTLI